MGGLKLMLEDGTCSRCDAGFDSFLGCVDGVDALME